ncbi:MAG: hypothetical protein J0I47_03320 [Sphingomonas sp.]|uniref:hypothetical protein n=1 Tax=Sphingomonas sp. TaxID=28214 RepID=UPI001AD31A26|nr:hypothetical protein [Sphingomonas sp.]MBN8807257.1 hypothetical protein [Sphingomonas sp.]
MADTTDTSNTDGATGGSATNGGATMQSLKDNVVKFANDAGDRAKTVAEDGKSRAGDALDDLARMLHDAAGTVDEKVGEQYGQYARTAAEAVGNFSQSLQAKSVDDIIDEARELAKKSPAIAIGTAAAIGFVLARLVKAGLEAPSPAKPADRPESKSA